MTFLRHGAYSLEVPEFVGQLQYAGGGHGGCGGYLEVLELDLSPPVFLIHEFRTDTRGQLWRWKIISGDAIDSEWNAAMSYFNPSREGFSEWSTVPFWQSEQCKAL
jgi:hypothetical protein